MKNSKSRRRLFYILLFSIIGIGLLIYFESGYISNFFNGNKESSSKNLSIDVNKKGNYSSLGEWYFHNAPSIYKNNIKSNDEFKKGYKDAYDPKISVKYINDENYQQGFIIGRTTTVPGHLSDDQIPPTNSRNDFPPSNYNKSIDLYKEAMNFINRMHITANYLTFDENSGRWTDGNNKSNDSDSVLKGPVAEHISDKTDISSLADWYYNNAPSIYKNNYQNIFDGAHGNLYSAGDSNSTNDGSTPATLTVEDANEITYQEGFIIGFAYTTHNSPRTDLTTSEFKSVKIQDYKNSIKAYQEALSYIKSHKLKSGQIKYDKDKQVWEPGVGAIIN